MPPPKKSNKSTSVDISDDVENTATSSDLEVISKMADRAAELSLLIEEEQQYLKTLTDEKYRIETVSLPEAMQSCGMKEFKTTNGAAVKVVDFIQVSLPAAGAIDKAIGNEKVELELRLKEGLKFISDHGGDSIIKSIVQVSFEKGQAPIKKAFFEAILKKGYAAISAETVHPQTLKSWVSEKISNGLSVPTETFSLYSGTKAEVKLPVKKK